MNEHEHGPDEGPIDVETLGWEAEAPPPGFAARVAATHAGETTDAGTTTARRLTRPLATVAVAVAAILVAVPLVMWLLGRAPVHDAVATTKIETLRLADRAVAVAQAGTVLRWQVDAGGATVVEQDVGRVFYRVDHGESFDVKTPGGTVTVTGTCFEVDVVKPMDIKRTAIKSGTLGAVLAASVVVTVYEGGVVLANDKGSVEVAAGQRAGAVDGRRPRRYSDDDDSAWADGGDTGDPKIAAAGTHTGPRTNDAAAAHVVRQARDIERLKAEKDAQYEELERLRTQVEELGGEPLPPGPEAAAAKAKRCATASRTPDCPFLNPSPETLKEMARCASVKIDHPPFLDDLERPDATGYAEGLGLTSKEDIAGMQAAADAHYDAYTADLRKMFLDLGGSEDLAQSSSPSTMSAYIRDQVDGDAVADVQRRVARERAGLVLPPASLDDLSIEERMFRLNAELGNDFEAHLAKQLGPERTRALRALKDGWPGSTGVHSGRCEDE